GEPSRLDFLARDDAEVLQDALQQIFLGKKRIEHQRRERGAIDLLEERPAQRRLAGPDVAGDDDEALAPADGVLQQIERVGVRTAAIEILRIRRQAERLLGESVILLVHGQSVVETRIFGVSRISVSMRFLTTTVERPNQPPLMPALRVCLTS